MAPTPPPDINTVQDVLDVLDDVIDGACERGDRIGYFAAMYRQVTAKVKEGIETGFFDDGERMERFDIIFANRYLAALSRFREGGKPTRSWELTFEAAAKTKPVIVQHLLCGMNAHINLDLGIAAASVAPGADLPGLRRDFDRINEILAMLVETIEDDVAEVSPWIGLLDRLGGRHDDEVVSFSIEAARTEAWNLAAELAPLAPADWAAPIAAHDAVVSRVGARILNPYLLTGVLLLIRTRESNDVPKVIRVLSGVTPPSLAVVEQRVQTARSKQPLSRAKARKKDWRR